MCKSQGGLTANVKLHFLTLFPHVCLVVMYLVTFAVVFFHDRKASYATLIACSTSSVPMSGTELTTSRVEGFMTETNIDCSHKSAKHTVLPEINHFMEQSIIQLITLALLQQL